jgi:hypothetical protein
MRLRTRDADRGRRAFFGSVPEAVARIAAGEGPLLIVEGGWGGKILFLSERHGLSIWNAAFLEKDDNLRRLRKLGYNKLVLISESPLATALHMTNPGGANYQRKTYEPALTPQSRAWPTVYQDEDVVVKTLPD